MKNDKRVVLITGGFGGIGFSTGKMFSRNGYQVVLADTQIKKTHFNANTFLCDLRDVGDITRLFGFIKEKFGRLDVLVTAHGVHSSVKSTQATETDFNEVLDANLKSVFFCCKETLLLMKQGTIINVGSSVGIVADKDAPLYSVSKAAIHQLTKCLAQEYGKRVRVNAIAPGPVDTPFLRGAFKNNKKVIANYRRKALRGIATPEEVAQMIYFMASDSCKFMNGAIVSFDGGESILYTGEPAK